MAFNTKLPFVRSSVLTSCSYKNVIITNNLSRYCTGYLLTYLFSAKLHRHIKMGRKLDQGSHSNKSVRACIHTLTHARPRPCRTPCRGPHPPMSLGTHRPATGHPLSMKVLPLQLQLSLCSLYRFFIRIFLLRVSLRFCYGAQLFSQNWEFLEIRLNCSF